MTTKDTQRIISATQFLEKNNITAIELKDTIENLKISLLVRCPREISIHVSGTAILANDNACRAVQSLSKRHKGTPFSPNHDYHSTVDSNIIFFPVTPTEWEKIIKYGEISKHEMTQYIFHENKNSLTLATAHVLLQESLKPLKSIITDAELFTTTKNSNFEPEEIIIRKADIFIRSEDSNKIMASIAEANRQNKQIERPEWQSDKLFKLNRAADKFIIEANITSESARKEIIGKIKIHLQEVCDYEGKDLIEQAALAILPDNHYTYSLKKNTNQILINQHPKHVSTTLAFINEAAIHFHQKTKKSIQKIQDNRAEIINILTFEWGFTKKMAGAAATIISLKVRAK